MRETSVLSHKEGISITTTTAKKINKSEDPQLEVGDVVLVPAPCTVSGRVRTQTGSRWVTPTTTDDEATITVNEEVLPNGDLYWGTFSRNVPHGTGKYLWADGCMYQGEWKTGKANGNGNGKFSWPSGSTYEGQFNSGRIQGLGTFTGSDGDTYRGTWAVDRRHGFGEKRYANRDVYMGSWKGNLQDGEGRYVWNNGNEYIGEWNNGVMSANGVLIWANGKRYEGDWQDGVPKGTGVFTRPDGSCYGAPWSDDRKRSSVEGSERNVTLPRICIWESDGEAGDITCDIINDNMEASMFCRDVGQTRKSPCLADDANKGKKPGHTISKGHKNYELMLNLQLGIRYTTGKHALILRQLRAADFDPKEKFWTRFPPEGSKFTPPHQSVDFRWKDYCPMVFRRLREVSAIDHSDYMVAICGNDALREFSSPGKSGSFFYLTQDDRFMIKTVKKSEVKVLIRMLPSYYEHVCQYKNSLVTKFFGVHCVKPAGGQKTRFIVMGNLFYSEYRIHRRFDLKGSSHGRTIDKPQGEIDETTTLKDLDLNFVFCLQRSWYQGLIRQIDRDTEFLEAEKIMDYSLLIGVHFHNDYSDDEMNLSPFDMHSGKRDAHQNAMLKGGHHLVNAVQDMDWNLEGRKPCVQLSANMPARAVPASRMQFDRLTGSGSSNSTLSRGCGEILDVVLYLGVIDILQDYDISKKLEHAYKSLQVDPTSISAVDPKHYSKRFRDFVHTIFVEDDQ